ncbi:Hyaluronan / mRNA binding family isoform 4 [Theobroma cacao]|uniref:Hyaluronan / mRNA binding family isoform 4 n=1 Tax=Theobroma cacao TaxID=3641 RepID=A0A061DVP9_THECC|nr:Hyaluronan / mRNA binding family isoform 4 [Theobroma cacao]
MRPHSATVLYLLVKVLLKRERVESPLKGVAMVALVLTVVVAAVVSVMGKLDKGSDLAGCMNAIVGLDAGKKNELKREGSGRGNWGTQTDELAQVTEEVVNESEKNLGDEKPAGEEDAGDASKESPTNEPEEKEPEDKEMTLEEYEKVLEEKRKALQALKTEERKVDAKEFATMQQLSNKKSNDEVFIKLGSEKDKRKEAFDKEERAKKSVSINEFLKPAEGERYYNPSGRGRGRGRGSRGFGGGSAAGNVSAPSIEDPGQFPTLGGK